MSMNILKRFSTQIQIIMTLLMFIQISFIVGLSATPGIYAAINIYGWAGTFALSNLTLVFVACSLGVASFFCYTLLIIIIVPVMRIFSFGSPLGRFPLYSFKAITWASYNSLILVVRFTCLNFIKATPFIILFHRLMGMKIGHRVQINTPIIGDSNLISIGDDTVIGGDVTITPHVYEKGHLILEPIVIGNEVTIGLMSIIMPGCKISDGATLAANTVLKKGTVVGENEIWAGIPGRKISA